MPISMPALAGDLAAESAELRAVLTGLDDALWQRDTPAEGWTIADQVSHLAYFDDVATRAVTSPTEFVAEKEEIDAGGGLSPDLVAARYRHLPARALLAWFDEARARLITTFAAVEPSLRVPWFGPSMSAASALTARIMETWAHGQDVADSLGLAREPSPRLRHVADLGVRARPFSYAVHGRDVPDVPVLVQLDAPDGSRWTWGPEDAADRITGPAVDFALLITRRRHLDDLRLAVAGAAAREWAEIGQAFAGEPGTGRKSGQFR